MQLHDFVDAVTADEPPLRRTADDIIAAGRKAERRRRAGFASAGAAGLAAVAVAGAFVLPGNGNQNVTAPAAQTAGAKPKPGPATWAKAAPFTFTFEGYKAGKLEVQNPVVASTAYQIASIYADGAESNDQSISAEETAHSDESIIEQKRKAKSGPPTLWAYLTVFQPGAFDPTGIKGAKPATVGGHKALQATLPYGLDPKNDVDPGNKLVAWEYTDGAWAVATSISSSPEYPSFDDLGGLAAGLKPSEPKAAKVPFTVGHVPDGYQPLQVGTHATAGLDGIASARDGNFGGATYTRPALPASGLIAPFDSGEDAIKDGFQISVTPSRNSNQNALAGKTKCYAGGFCNVWSADGKVQVQVSAQTTGNKLSQSELRKVVTSIKVANVADESTWTPAAKALRP